MFDEATYLGIVEGAHKRRVGEGNFCYVAVPWGGHARAKSWVIAVTAKDIDGYIPITEDLFLGTEAEMCAKAIELNSKRLDILPRHAARIIGASMAHSNSRKKA